MRSAMSACGTFRTCPPMLSDVRYRERSEVVSRRAKTTRLTQSGSAMGIPSKRYRSQRAINVTPKCDDEKLTLCERHKIEFTDTL